MNKEEWRKILAEVRGLLKQLEGFIETLDDMAKKGVSESEE